MLLFRIVRAGEPVEKPFDRAHGERKERALAGIDAGEEAAERPGDGDNEAAEDENLEPAGEGHGSVSLNADLKSLRTDECEQQIGDHGEGNRPREKEIDRHGIASQALAGERIGLKEGEGGDAGEDQQDVEHGSGSFMDAGRCLQGRPSASEDRNLSPTAYKIRDEGLGQDIKFAYTGRANDC